MRKYTIRIPVAKKRFVEGRLDVPDPQTDLRQTSLIMAHGAANDMHEPLLRRLASGLCRAGFPILRFNFPYRTEGRKNPDSQRVLEASWLEAVGWMRGQTTFPMTRLVAGGKSMGARVASQLAGAGRLTVDGLAFWGYPLHPPGRKDQLRDSHLDQIQMPMLFVAGTRDAFCDLTLLDGVLARLGNRATREIVDGGDHSFRIPNATEARQKAVYDHILARTNAWLTNAMGGP